MQKHKNGKKRWGHKALAFVGKKPRGVTVLTFKPRDPGPAAPGARLPVAA